MKKLFMIMYSVVLLAGILNAKEFLIDGFDEEPADTSYWLWFEQSGMHFESSENSVVDPDTAWITKTYVTDDVAVGPGALKIDFATQNAEAWGGYSKFEHWHPDSGAAYDWSLYDTLAFWYKVEAEPNPTGKVHLRLNLYDVSDESVPDTTTNSTEVEMYYSFHYILDDVAEWTQIKIPLIYGDYWDGEGFNRTGWNGIAGNNILDLDQIRGWNWEISMAGGGEGDVCTGSFMLDNMELRGYKGNNLIVFSGKTVNAAFEPFTWGQSALEVIEGEGTDGSNALVWTQGDEWSNGWTGAGWNIPSTDLSYEWETDSIKFRMKNPIGAGNIRLQFESPVGNKKIEFEPVQNENWNDYAFALADFVYEESTEFDSSDITVFQFVSTENAVAGNKYYFDFLWTGNPPIDEEGPIGVEGATAAAVDGEFYNIIGWEDVPGETLENYTVFASLNPITDVTADGVEIIANKLAEGTGFATHYLVTPLESFGTKYYYAIRCDDLVGNEGEVVIIDQPVVNTGRPQAVIASGAPGGFAVDGDLSEWQNSDMTPFVVSPSTGKVTIAGVEDDDDLTGTVYIAVDDDNLYFGAYVIDDEYLPREGDWWNNDAFECFIGLYDNEGASKHTAHMRGEEPDYKLVFNAEYLNRDYTNGGGALYDTSMVDGLYFFSDLGGADYIIEAVVPLDSMNAHNDDARFHPVEGMKIPIELTFHDKDSEGNGNVTTSFANTDNAHITPTVWTSTWIENWTLTSNEKVDVASNYDLKQNYPNPFNPSTSIAFEIPSNEFVTLTIYNLLGQKMTELINRDMVAGSHVVTLNASNLPSGMYFYTLNAGEYNKTMKMILMK